jgi:hypothetical protein
MRIASQLRQVGLAQPVGGFAQKGFFGAEVAPPQAPPLDHGQRPRKRLTIASKCYSTPLSGKRKKPIP